MSKEKMPESKSSAMAKVDTKIVKSHKKIKKEDLAFIQPTKPMTAKEVLEEVEAQGMRVLTIEELRDLIDQEQPKIIEPRGRVIDVDSEEPKKLKSSPKLLKE